MRRINKIRKEVDVEHCILDMKTVTGEKHKSQVNSKLCLIKTS
jgi:hypothetical protein